MLKKSAVQFSMLAMVWLITCPELFAQTRIHFVKGRTSATVSGSIVRNGYKCFVLKTREGQSLDATVSSRSGKVQFPWASGAGYYKGGTSHSRVTSGGDEELCIENGGNATTFTLTISVH